MDIVPALSANFLQVPTDFVEYLYSQNLSRNELLVILRLARQMFDFRRSSLFVSLLEIASSTGLDRAAAEQALAKACDRGLVLKFVVENDGSSVYTLHTPETSILMDNHEPAPDSLLKPDEEPRHVPTTLEPTHVPGDDPKTIPPTARQAIVWSRLTQLLRRAPTKDESDRLSVAGATDDQLLAAMDSVEARKIRIYSSDQILYEYERLQREQRSQQDLERRHAGATHARQKTRLCTKCGGTGYLFSGSNSIRVCDCKK